MDSIVLTSILAGSETFAMTMLTKYAKDGKPLFLLTSVLLYGLIIPFFILKSLNFDGIGTVNLMWNIITTVSMIIVGYYFFGEKITHMHLLSLLLGISSVVLLFMAEK